MIIIIYLILCGLIAMYAGSEKLSAVGFFFIALVLSPIIAFIIVGVTKERG